MLSHIRRILAAVAIAMLTLLFLDFTGTAHAWFGWMARIQFLPAVLALNVGVIVALCALTLLFGRIYCSVICPLGIMQDLLARLPRLRKRHKPSYSYSPERRWLRYGVLALFILAMLTGVGSFVALLAPYSSFGRIVSQLLSPLYLWGNNLLAAIAEHYDSYRFYSVDVWLKSLPTLLTAAATFALLAVLAWRNGRTYCNTICPVGTVLGFLSRFSLLRIRFDKEKCRHCSQCTKHCKAACIDYKTLSVDHSRCVVCGNCIDSCQFGALRYSLPRTKQTETQPAADHTADANRRQFLAIAATATVGTMLAQQKKKVDGGLAAIEEKEIVERHTPLTPPGSQSARHMQRHCTGCQLCVQACPNDVLRPSASLLTLMQPTMGYERGYCRPECTRCSQVCPAGAIRPITTEQKSGTQIGHAVWVRKNCLPLTDGVSCGNCERHCPTGAIQMIPSIEDDWDAPLIPAVNTAKCIGCGACEHLCPARPTAIYVEGHESHREI